MREIRDALGMSAEQLGSRIGMTQSSVQRLETSGAAGTIQLNSLRRLAESPKGELVYVLVPRETPAETYDSAARVSHSIALEDQAEDERLRRFIAESWTPRDLGATPVSDDDDLHVGGGAATNLAPEEQVGLIARWIATRDDLNRAERADIVQGLRWAARPFRRARAGRPSVGREERRQRRRRESRCYSLESPTLRPPRS